MKTRSFKARKQFEKSISMNLRAASRTADARRPERRRMLEIDPVLFSRLLQISLGSDRK